MALTLIVQVQEDLIQDHPIVQEKAQAQPAQLLIVQVQKNLIQVQEDQALVVAN